MSKKLYALITGVIGGLAAVAEAVVAYTRPQYWGAIMTAIPLVTKCADEVLLLFVKAEA